MLLAASSLAASFLGQQAFQHPSPRGLAIAALAAFVVSIAASVFILLPKKNLIFAEAGAGLYEGLYAFRDDMPEVYRRLAYDLDLFWDSNDTKIKWLTRAYTVAATALVVEVLSLAALLGDNGRSTKASNGKWRNPTAPPSAYSGPRSPRDSRRLISTGSGALHQFAASPSEPTFGLYD